MEAETKQTMLSQQDVDGTQESKEVSVTFHSTKLRCIVEPNGVILVPIRPICDAIGLHVDSAWSSIKNDEILGSVHALRHGRDSKNRKNLMTYLPIEHVHGWLFSIQTSKVSSKAKPKLLQFKKECYQVLFEHFYGKYRVYESNLKRRLHIQNRIAELQQSKNNLNNEIDALKKELKAIEQDEFSNQLKLV